MGAIWHMKVQMCTNLNERKFLASVSRINQAGQRVVFDTPEFGSYIENKKTRQNVAKARVRSILP